MERGLKPNAGSSSSGRPDGPTVRTTLGWLLLTPTLPPISDLILEWQFCKGHFAGGRFHRTATIKVPKLRRMKESILMLYVAALILFIVNTSEVLENFQ